MSTPSSLYAEKIFAEHPVAFWPLDDKADYISLISETNRNLSLWDIDNGSSQLITDILTEPFPESHTSKLTVATPSTTNPFVVSAVSPNLVNLSDINEDLSNISLGVFLYSNSSYISGFEIGYEYTDASSGNVIQNTKFFSTTINRSWIFLSETFTPPIQNVSMRFVIKAKFFNGDLAENYSFLVNGISVGQWSEEFNASSLGVVPVNVPTEILQISNLKAVPAKAYGLQQADGYYLLRDGALAAKNSGIPMVFGAKSSTIIQQNLGRTPAVIFPGQGFLNESGKYKDYTFEFWTRINSDSTEERRIFGNIRGTDGIYIKGPTLSLKINNYVIRHYVGEWSRPMLIQIRYSSSSISLLVNGEQVGELPIDIESIEFPKATTQSGSLTLQNDWVGFWSYNTIKPVEIDGVAIYGYVVPIQVAKRRFVYGQGVEFPENINNAYSGSSIFIDYPFSKYSKNYSYPGIGKWQQGAYDNLSIVGNSISFPSYQLPQARFNNKTSDEWLSALKSAQNEIDDTFIKLRPNSSWNSTRGHLFLENFSLANEDIKGFYIVCKEMTMPAENAAPQTLISIEDARSNSTFEIRLDYDGVHYILIENGVSHSLVSRSRQYLEGVGEKNVIGIDIRKFSDYYGGKAAQFFGNLSSPLIYIGSNKEFEQLFTGNIYSVGFSSAKNLQKISSAFGVDGLSFSDTFVDASIFLPHPSSEQLPYSSLADAGLDVTDQALFDFLYDGGTLGQYAQSVISDHIASYAITVGNNLSGFNILIGSDSSWQDYIPLSVFAKQSLDARGDSRSDLDFIQFNVNYPAPSVFLQETENSEWTYAELREEYLNPIQRTYESLDNQLFTGYENYEDLANKSVSSYKYDTSKSVVKTYVTFQLLEEGANKPTSSFTLTELAPKNGIITPGPDWIDTKYEVVDNMIIYPPASMSFDDLAIVTHIEMTSQSINDTPIFIKSLEYASMSLSETSPTPVGTRFGNDIFPYRKDGFYFNYKSENPFSIYKGSTPYLYLTRNSGITIRGNYDPIVNRGISIPINENKSDDFKVIAMQMALRFDQDFFPYAPMQIFEIQSSNSYIKVFAVANHPSGQRAKLYAINSRGELEDGLAFYLNGNIVKDPVISVKEWTMLGISFANTQQFEQFAGAIRLTGPLTFNNISYYKSTNLQEVTNTVERPWFKVKLLGTLDLDWGFWNPAYMWNNVLVISETSYYGVNPSDIYKVYTGTNKIIIDDEVETTFGKYSYTVAEDVLWRSQVYQAV